MTFAKLIFSYPLHRAIVALLSFASVLIAARILPAEIFSKLITAAFLAKFLHISNLGATSGYFVNQYSGHGSLAKGSFQEEGQYMFLFYIQMTIIGLLVAGLTFILQPNYLLGAIVFLIITPLFIIEPFLRYRQNFSFSLAPEFILSVALLSVVAAHLLGDGKSNHHSFYVGTIILVSIFLIFLSMKAYSLGVFRKVYNPNVKLYREILKDGFPLYVTSSFFLLASSFDRLFVPLYRTDEQIGLYFLACQLSVGAMIFLTAINFMNTVKIGEQNLKEDKFSKRIITNKLLTAFFVAILSYVALGIGAFIIENMFLPESFKGLTSVVLILGAGLAVFYISNSVTPLVAYYKRQLPLTISMGLAACFIFLSNSISYWLELDLKWLALGTSVTLFAYGCFGIWFTYFIISQRNRDISS